MSKDIIQLLVTFDENYISPFETLLLSIKLNNPGQDFHVWLLHSNIPEDKLDQIQKYCAKLETEFTPIAVDRKLFENAPVTDRYPQEMYYRLLAPQLLPDDLDKIIYLDPDILVINPLTSLWKMNLTHYTFAAASHKGITDVMNSINKIRLNTNSDYFNTGLLLIDLQKARKLVDSEKIFADVREHADELVLPDQDVFNHLYGDETLSLPDEIWNYDARYYSMYLLRGDGSITLDWVMKNTIILHFAGRRKPWLPNSTAKFVALYKNYMQMTQRALDSLGSGQ